MLFYFIASYVALRVVTCPTSSGDESVAVLFFAIPPQGGPRPDLGPLRSRSRLRRVPAFSDAGEAERTEGARSTHRWGRLLLRNYARI